jgi:carboxypeptidase C (cathepsin A)
MKDHPRSIAFVLVSVLLALVSLPAIAQDDEDAKKDPSSFVTFPEEPSVTYHSVEIDGETVHYQATAGTITLARNDDNEPTARMFFISYRMMDGAVGEGEEPSFPDPYTRPITFSFNGGPGSSSVWLHLGVFGPKRVAPVDEFGNPGPPPHMVIDNEYSLLDQSDFVFIDPVSTGFSRAEEGTSPKDFHGVNEDIRSVAEFIRIFLGRDNRWASPKYIAGESYGTTRAAGLADELHGTHGISLNGVMLVSSILNFGTARFDVGNDLPYPLFLPSFAATAHYHGKLSSKYQNMGLEAFLEEVEQFAMTDYTLALMQGDRLSDKDRAAVAKKLSGYLGIEEEYIEDVNLRVNMPRFPKELLRDEGYTVGRFDSRFKGRDREDEGQSHEYDPSYAAIRSIYTESMNDYLRRGLGYESDMRYEILTNVWPWSFRGVGDNQYLNIAERLRSVMHEIPSMLVFIASGYYDLATPYFATDWTVDHMFLRPEIRDNVETHYYEAGHMMYMRETQLDKMRDDLVGFYAKRESR